MKACMYHCVGFWGDQSRVSTIRAAKKCREVQGSCKGSMIMRRNLDDAYGLYMTYIPRNPAPEATDFIPLLSEIAGLRLSVIAPELVVDDAPENIEGLAA